MSRFLTTCLLFIALPIIAQKTANTIAVLPGDNHDAIIEKAIRVVPTPAQYAALKREFIAFVHFGPNSFTQLEWGSGKEDPRQFDLKELHTDQWCAAMKAAGMKLIILTAKHHDGFVLWQSRYTTHGIMSTGFKNGKGDIIKELAASCKKFGIKLGIYLSPADLFQIESETGLYGNGSSQTKRTIPRAVPGRPFANKTQFQFVVDDYNEYFLNQLFELLTEYGPVDEVWFDGAHPKRKGNQQYNYNAWKKLIKTLAPQSVVFGKEDIRWCGNEGGRTRPTEWNIIPYEVNPDTAQYFHDLMAPSLGAREDLYKGKYLHYQPAETNTSIREGWFYRNDTEQKVRSADDVFDIYERAAGGNSTFLLNIPPNREGKFAPRDVAVLEEVGKRIRETYTKNLFAGVQGAAFDNNPGSFIALHSSQLEWQTPQPVTINRLLIQEAVTTHSERVEQHAVDAWIEGNWKEIAAATNIGYKRILRFNPVTSKRFRLRILATRAVPAISNITGHFYKAPPPALAISRSSGGQVTIQAAVSDFGWNAHGQNLSQNLGGDQAKIFYTTDGSAPTAQSTAYTGPFAFTGQGNIKAISVLNRATGAVASQEMGYLAADWKLIRTDSEEKDHPGTAAIDGNTATYWQSGKTGSHFIELDLSTPVALGSFSYTPQTDHHGGMMEKGLIRFSDNGTDWKTAYPFEFGNLVNDPTVRRFIFPKTITARYIRIEASGITGNDPSMAIAELLFYP